MGFEPVSLGAEGKLKLRRRRIVSDLLSNATSQLDMTSPELLPLQQYWDVYVLDGPRSHPIFLPFLHGH
uniref:Uncharacterized protein n=1 Tax=Timema shepardi TaxID=629360 RepID=A0A7R9FZ58_TIMSH|nr:unnamed protein product [Timema shepardi]